MGEEAGKAFGIEKFDGTTSRIGGCRLKIIFMGGNYICLFWGQNLRL